MNRTIKFRGMRKDNNEWVYGYYTVIGATHYISQQLDEYSMYSDIEVIPETVGQLCQHEGKEYWEGDYDKDGNMLHFCQSCQGWQFAQIDVPTKDVIFCHNCDGNFDFQEHINDFVPISNIHQHPTQNG